MTDFLGASPFDRPDVALWLLGGTLLLFAIVVGWVLWQERPSARRARARAAWEAERQQRAREIAALKALGEAYAGHRARRLNGRRVFDSRGKP